MDLYALDSEVVALETTLSFLDGTARLNNLLSLAWYLRQSQNDRSLMLLEDANALLAQITSDPSQILAIKKAKDELESTDSK